MKYFPVLIVFLLWEIASKTGIVPQSLLPSFIETLKSFFSMLISGELIRHTRESLLREIAGFLLSVITGTTLGISMARFQRIKDFFEPLVTVTYPIPKPALIPIFMIWLGIGHASKIAVIFVGCLIPILISSYNGAKGVDPFIIWSARSMGTSEKKLLWKVIIPAALPEILSGIRIALAFSFVLLVSSELVAARAGLGFLIFFTGESGAYSSMFAAVMTVTLLGFTADRLYQLFVRKILKWMEESVEKFR